MSSHQSVLYQESLDALAIQPNGRYIDGTFGRGGHSHGILNALGPQGILHVFDKDPDAISVAERLQAADPRVVIHHASFAEMGRIDTLQGQVNGIFLDLGVSSPQLDQAERGFSFLKPGPLDMRMDPTSGESVAELLTHINEQDLAKILKQYGEERQAKRLARAILQAQRQTPLTTTKQLADLVEQVLPYNPHKHPATRTFQALRIFINRELEDLEACLAGVPNMLVSGGVLAVLSFHSLEDRIVKHTLRSWVEVQDVPIGLPIPQAELDAAKTFDWQVKRAVASEAEVAENSRSRSATLRAVRKR